MSNSTKKSKRDPDAERRARLRDYVEDCLIDSDVRWKDLASPTVVVDKIVRVMAGDAPAVAKDLKKRGIAGALRLGGAFLNFWANQTDKRRE